MSLNSLTPWHGLLRFEWRIVNANSIQVGSSTSRAPYLLYSVQHDPLHLVGANHTCIADSIWTDSIVDAVALGAEHLYEGCVALRSTLAPPEQRDEDEVYGCLCCRCRKRKKKPRAGNHTADAKQWLSFKPKLADAVWSRTQKESRFQYSFTCGKVVNEPYLILGHQWYERSECRVISGDLKYC